MNAVARFLDSDFAYSFSRTPVAIISAVVVLVVIVGAVFAPLLSRLAKRWISAASGCDSSLVVASD